MHARMHEIHQRLDQQNALPVSRAVKAQNLALIQPQGLFAQNRLTGGQHAMGIGAVGIMRRRDIDSVNIVARQKRGQVIRWCAAMLGAEISRFLPIAGGHTGQHTMARLR